MANNSATTPALAVDTAAAAATATPAPTVRSMSMRSPTVGGGSGGGGGHGRSFPRNSRRRRAARRVSAGLVRTVLLMTVIASALMASWYAAVVHRRHHALQSFDDATVVPPPLPNSFPRPRPRARPGGEAPSGARDEGGGRARKDDEDDEAAAVLVVGYAITLTKCASKSTTHPPSSFLDAAAVLRRSIQLNSHPLHPTSRYASRTYALVHPTASTSPCADGLRKLNYTVLTKDIPVPLDDIPSESILRKRLRNDGCCGETEYVKLHSYGLTDHEVAVHLDLDSLLLRPLDELFDCIVHPPTTPRGLEARKHLLEAGIVAPTYTQGLPSGSIDAFYTKDYNMIQKGKHRRVGVQGGFLVLRPSLSTLDSYREIIRKGDFRPGRDARTSGWGGSGYGLHIYGAMTFQGIVPYYYDVVASGTGVEVHRCRFNQMGDNPRRTTHQFPRPTPLDPTRVDYEELDECRDGREDCDDVQCQTWPMDDVRSVHYNYCGKPWDCEGRSKLNGTLVEKTCRDMHRRWFEIRDELERERKGVGVGGGGGDGEKGGIVEGGEDPAAQHYKPESFLGYCTGGEPGHYVPLYG